LAQRYRDWLERPIPELAGIVEEARRMPEFAVFKTHLAEEFEKTDRSKLVRGCTVEFDHETWPDKTVRTESAITTDKTSPAE
jgi:hypothetical protein